MAEVIGRAGSALNIRLGESPNVKDPMLNVELQEVYNALHLLSGYMAALSENLESAPGQTPSESLRFRRTFWAPALQTIAVGAVVSPLNSGIMNGVLSTEVVGTQFYDGIVSVGSTGNRPLFGVNQLEFGIALTAANPGDLVQVGQGPGVLQLNGAKCGQLVWGVDSRSIYTERNANDSIQNYGGRLTLVGNGGLYLANITGSYGVFPSPRYWEGYWLPGYPRNDSGVYKYNRVFLYPIGVCIADSYVLFYDFKRSDPLPLTN